MLTWQLMWRGQKSASSHGVSIRRHMARRVCERIFWRVCAQVCAHVIRDIKLPFQDNVISQYHLYDIYKLKPVIFCYVRLFLCFM